MSLCASPLARISTGAVSAPSQAGRILLVEDQAPLALLLARRLEAQGHEVLQALDGLDALGKLQSFEADVIISDWVMEPLDGLEFCRRLRADARMSHAYFIMLTAKERLEDRLEAFKAGIDEYLIKPVVDQELIERVRVGLRISRLQRDLARSNADLSQSLRRIREDLAVVGRIQRSLLPRRMPTDHFECAVVYSPCEECGGDYYDFIPVPGNRLAVVVADVSGHGTPAMVAMAIIRSLVHWLLPTAEEPGKALDHLGDALWHHLPTEQYATMFLGLWDPATGTLRHSSAGHPAPLVLRRTTGAIEKLPGEGGFPLKLIEERESYSTQETRLERGDRLILYTDGIIEAFDSAEEQFGRGRLQEALMERGMAPLGEMREHVLSRLLEFCGPRLQEDDITMLLLEVR